ncbi:MAG: hypothetical protein LC135_01310 [Phycisphaerae bacterium]|nr:hypothetical protein [Phycisphaerae bacterium]MCZ2398490.1 hypothetical protein [Phycisphaerae bacterium]NUQ49433.1 hypothetical protein [Phycisphaerae bacterium]
MTRRMLKLVALIGCGGALTAVTGCGALALTVGQGLLSGYLSSVLADAVGALLSGGGAP